MRRKLLKYDEYLFYRKLLKNDILISVYINFIIRKLINMFLLYSIIEFYLEIILYFLFIFYVMRICKFPFREFYFYSIKYIYYKREYLNYNI